MDEGEENSGLSCGPFINPVWVLVCLLCFLFLVLVFSLDFVFLL